MDINDEKTFETGKAAVEKYGAKCITIRADVTEEDQVEHAIAETVKEFGRIDYCANFAGIVGPLGNSWEIDTKDWKKVIDINLIGVWLCTKLEMKQMLTQESIAEGIEEGRVPQRGSIVNCASVNSIQAGGGTTGYTAAKHGVVGITKAAALEGRDNHIRVNAVSPGFLQTNLFDSMGGLENDVWKVFEARQGRVANNAEVGDVVVLLSTPRMSLVNGHNLVIDNGFTINENAL